MRLKYFDYVLPKNLIAQQPVSPRDHSRLLILDKKTGTIKHKHFYDIVDYLRAGDILVLNNTKVMRARLMGRRAETGGRVEVFLLKAAEKNIWQCLIGGKRIKENLKVNFAGGLKAEIIKNNHNSAWLVKFSKSGREFIKIVEKIGQVPLPPYIKRSAYPKASADKQNYQTVYADEKKLGSVAAPTAGLHFTKKLIYQLKKKGVQFEYVTLQVGLGTFASVKTDDIAKHKMHAEWVEARAGAIRRVQKASDAYSIPVETR